MNDLNGKFFASQSPGKRDYQEDEFGLLDARESHAGGEEHAVIVVADGMGGHVGGDRASGLVTETFIDTYQHAEGDIFARLRQALDAANASLTQAIQDDAGLQGMGSTLVAAVVSGASLRWISVGDSPLWLFRDGELRRLNADHSMAPVLQEMVTSGRLTQEQADTDPGRHSLLSVLMGGPLELIDFCAEAVPLRDSDIVVLASDGLLTLPSEQIAALIAENALLPVADIVEGLQAAVAAADIPSQDNVTIALYREKQAELPRTVPVQAAAVTAAALKDTESPVRPHRYYLGIICALLIVVAGLLFLMLDDGSGVRVEPAPAETPVPKQPIGSDN